MVNSRRYLLKCSAKCEYARPSTSFLLRYRQDVDARDKPGHDELRAISFDSAPASARHLLRVIEESLLDQLLAAPGLQRHLFHDALGAVLPCEFEPPADRAVVAVEKQWPEPRGRNTSH